MRCSSVEPDFPWLAQQGKLFVALRVIAPGNLAEQERIQSAQEQEFRFSSIHGFGFCFCPQFEKITEKAIVLFLSQREAMLSDAPLQQV